MKTEIKKIIATNSQGEGLLPMKEGKEQEENKSVEQQLKELCNFVKSAFCVEGDVKLVVLDKPIETKEVFLIKDEKLGKYVVFFTNDIEIENEN